MGESSLSFQHYWNSWQVSKVHQAPAASQEKRALAASQGQLVPAGGQENQAPAVVVVVQVVQVVQAQGAHEEAMARVSA